ncbi:hypothetical protein K435DRAFT_869556 [Dendrothele bispora CBS 962.96]|uniref:Uncharacterized protein n=1 Tax=Dendrothele bispora (strain CBS 962.96) TaxID=1314807 RepID=A0A4S8L8W8_DENBC|nr:hypothetical protein K435DRAFT_869556 [Dendrothele bispora CBS 962.96]
MDANFRLKNQLMSSYSQDPGLGIGLAYFVGRDRYEEHIKRLLHEDDISTCVGFAALAKASTRFSRGLRYTGVGGLSCARSEMLMPTGVVNTEKGERYGNMDYCFASGLRVFTFIVALLVSYDIACQWFINLFTRMETVWPAHLKPSFPLNATNTSPAVGKFHEPAHKQEDHEEYSFNLIPGVGYTDGEGPERIWAGHNAVANATKPMGPGTRIDTLDDHFGFWNYQKYISFGKTLRTKYIKALAERNRQMEAHKGWSDRLPPELVSKWDKLCKAWEAAPFPKTEVENPYKIDNEFLGEEEVLKELELEDEERRTRSGEVSRNAVSVPSFIKLGLELEDTMRETHVLAKKSSPRGGQRQETELTAQRRTLTEKLEDVDGVSSNTLDPEEVKLWLLSDILAARREEVCVVGLVEVEDKLRTAQLNDCIHNLRHTLRVKSHMVLFKNKNIVGQRPGLRSRAIIDRVFERVKNIANRYRVLREAKKRLVGSGAWEEILQELKNSDVHSYRDQERLPVNSGRRGTNEDTWEPEENPRPEREERNDGDGIDLWTEVRDIQRGAGHRVDRVATGETRRGNSWIWTSGLGISLQDGADDENEVCRAEWCRSRARAQRAKEEVMLLKEEMKRTGLYLEWKEKWWKERVGVRSAERDAPLCEGLDAYAYKKAKHERQLLHSFREEWSKSLSEGDLEEVLTWEEVSDEPGNDSEDESSEEGDEGSDYDEGNESEGTDGWDYDQMEE